MMTIEEVRQRFLGQRVRIYRGLSMTVQRIESCPGTNCYQFFARGRVGDEVGFVTPPDKVVIMPKKRKDGTRLLEVC